MKANYRLICRPIKGKEIKLAGEKCGATKSAAGRLFQSPSVKSVLVADISGKVYLYLVKNHPEKTEEIKSSLATFG
jgi:hypothetical protein